MKLYHGTGARRLKRIRERGILPRTTSGVEGNWNHTVTSHRSMVYLTTAYAGYYASMCAREGEKWAIIEVDTDLLDETLLRPDEDFLAQVDQPPNRRPIKDIYKRTTWFRDHLDDFASEWGRSIEYLGNAAYAGAVPPSAITRVAVFDPLSNPYVAWTCADPVISVMNYLLLGGRYRALTRWLMGENVAVEEVSDTVHLLPPGEQERMAAQLAETRGRVVAALDAVAA